MYRQITHIFLMFIAFALFYSCNTKHTNKTDKIRNSLAAEKFGDNKPLLLPDTIMNLSLKSISKTNNVTLTEQNATAALYKYFKNRGLLTEDALPDSLTEKDYANDCVYFDTLFLLPKSNQLAGVIQYWITNPGASGQSYQPHKAMLLKTRKSFILANEDFIPDNFSIEKIIAETSLVTITGYVYDRDNYKSNRNFKINIFRR